MANPNLPSTLINTGKITVALGAASVSAVGLPATIVAVGVGVGIVAVGVILARNKKVGGSFK